MGGGGPRKTAAERWNEDRAKARDLAERKRAKAERDAALDESGFICGKGFEKGFVGRTQLGGGLWKQRLTAGKQGKIDAARRQHLHQTIEHGRKKKQTLNNSSEPSNDEGALSTEDEEEDDDDEDDDEDPRGRGGRSTPIRSEWVTKKQRSVLAVGKSVSAAEKFLTGNLGRSLASSSSGGGAAAAPPTPDLSAGALSAPSDVSTDESFRERLRAVTDPSLTRNMYKGDRANAKQQQQMQQQQQQQRRGDATRSWGKPPSGAAAAAAPTRKQQPMAGWIGDYSSSASDMFSSGGSERKRAGGKKGREWTNKDSSNSSAGNDTSTSGSGWNFDKILEKESVTSGSDLNYGGSGGGAGGRHSGISSGDLGDISGSTRFSNVMSDGGGSRSGGDSSVNSSDLYHAEALVNAPSSPSEDGSGGDDGRNSLSPESNASSA